MRYLLVASSLLLGSVTSAQAQVQVGVGIAMPGVQIGINVPAYPELVPVPGYPVYYDPRASSNYFFYDGAYWVYQGDSWYVSSWYNGPWYGVEPERVPLYVLRVPVRYYREPPPYFRGWRADAPPRWGEHWGRGWERGHRGWDRWDRRAVPRPAPLPVYQRSYAGDRYPQAPEHQRSIRAEQYGYRSREPVTRERFEPRGNPGPGPGHSRAERYPQAPGQERFEQRGNPGPGYSRGERYPQAADQQRGSAPAPQERDRGNRGGRRQDDDRTHGDEGQGHGRGR